MILSRATMGVENLEGRVSGPARGGLFAFFFVLGGYFMPMERGFFAILRRCFWQ